jgi:hypothetical protein
MNQKKLVRNARVKTTLIASALLLGVMTAPAHAAPSSGSSDPISSLTDWFNNQLKAVQQYADKFSEKFASLGDEFKGVTDGLLGDLGLADSIQAREKSKEASIDSKSPEYKGETVANEVDRQNATASSEAVLSQDGQKQQAKAYDQTQTSVENNQQYAEQAQGDEVTQNVMKRIASQTAETSLLTFLADCVLTLSSRPNRVLKRTNSLPIFRERLTVKRSKLITKPLGVVTLTCVLPLKPACSSRAY